MDRDEVIIWVIFGILVLLIVSAVVIYYVIMKDQCQEWGYDDYISTGGSQYCIKEDLIQEIKIYCSFLDECKVWKVKNG